MIKFSATLTAQYDTDFSPFKAEEFDTGLLWAQESGFDGVEICIANYDNLDVLRLKEKLNAHSLGCSTISTGQARMMEDISLLHKNPDQSKKAEQRILQHIDAAVILESKVTIGLLRGIGTLENSDAELNQLAKKLDPIINHAQKRGVTLLLEAINRYETALLNSAESTYDFIVKKLGQPSQLDMLWDVFHANIEDPSIVGAIDYIKTVLGHVHFADSNRHFPGYGHLDFGAIYNKLKAVNYDGYISFECLNLPTKEAVIEESKGFIAHLKKG